MKVSYRKVQISGKARMAAGFAKMMGAGRSKLEAKAKELGLTVEEAQEILMESVNKKDGKE